MRSKINYLRNCERRVISTITITSLYGMELVIRKYFQCWLDKDITIVKEIFSNNIIYSECYGPVYKGIEQVIRWFEDWNRKGTVLRWIYKEDYCFREYNCCGVAF